jgi:hypothetical protein
MLSCDDDPEWEEQRIGLKRKLQQGIAATGIHSTRRYTNIKSTSQS